MKIDAVKETSNLHNEINNIKQISAKSRNEALAHHIKVCVDEEVITEKEADEEMIEDKREEALGVVIEEEEVE